VEHRDRIRESSPDSANADLDAETRERVERVARAGGVAVDGRLRELEGEWDIERVLMANAATLALSGVAAAAATGDRRLLAVPGVVLAFLLQHAIQGWCPPVPAFRKLGVRTQQEIDAERTALKALRGDFAGVDGDAARALATARA
jgi:hypothetical protein